MYMYIDSIDSLIPFETMVGRTCATVFYIARTHFSTAETKLIEDVDQRDVTRSQVEVVFPAIYNCSWFTIFESFLLLIIMHIYRILGKLNHQWLL